MQLCRNSTLNAPVGDKGQIIGQHVTDNTRQEIANMLKLLEPFPAIDVEYMPLSDTDKHIIVFATKNNLIAPYTFEGCAYMRNQSTTTRMTQENYQELLLERLHSPKDWESMPAKNITIDDLDEDEILRTIQEGIVKNRIRGKYITDDPKKALMYLKLLRDDLPINAAVVLFAKDVSDHYMQCLIRMARFQGVKKSAFIDNIQEFGNLFYLLDTAMEFVRRHMPIAGEIKPGDVIRTDKPLIPVRAVREAIINALCHRDYTLENQSISIGIYDDRLEIISPGKLPKDMTLKKLKEEHNSCPRNKKVANVLFRRGVIEQWGSGTQEIIDECVSSGLPEPEFIEDHNSFIVRFRADFSAGIAKQAVKDYSGLTERQQEIIAIIKQQKTASLANIVSELKTEQSERTIQRNLETLKKSGFIDKTGHGRSTKWFLITT